MTKTIILLTLVVFVLVVNDNVFTQPNVQPKSGESVIFFPSNRLFADRLADPTEVQLSARILTRRNQFAGNIGYSLGMVQFGISDWQLQVRLEANMLLVSKVETPDFPVQSTDYTIAMPFDARKNRFSARLEIGHLSSHLGDNFNRIDDVEDRLEEGINYIRAKKYSKEYIRPFTAYTVKSIRIYGGFVWDFHFASNASENRKPDRITLQYGLEWFSEKSGPALFPYLALDIKHRQEFSWHLDANIQGGIFLQSDNGRRVRFALEIYRGYSNQGQFFRRLEEDFNLVLAFDF